MEIKKHNLPVTASDAYGATRFTDEGMRLWGIMLVKQTMSAIYWKYKREALVNKYGRFVRRL